MKEGATLIRTADLAAALGVHPDTVSRWSATRLRAARFARGLFKVAVLRQMGLLPSPPTNSHQDIIPHA